MTSILLSWQTRLSWQNTSFVATKVCLSQQNFCHNKIMFVVTKVLSWQNIFVATKIILVATPTNDTVHPLKSSSTTTRLCFKTEKTLTVIHTAIGIGCFLFILYACHVVFRDFHPYITWLTRHKTQSYLLNYVSWQSKFTFSQQLFKDGLTNSLSLPPEL